MKRRAKLSGDAIPYREARRLSVVLRESAKKSALAPAYIERTLASVGVWRGRFEQVLECARVVPEHVALTHADASALDHDDAARFERLDGRIDGLYAARHAEVG